MIVHWTREAIQDRHSIMDEIAGDNPTAAIELDETFEDAAAQLEAHPKIGRKGLIAGTREMIPHGNYRLVYEIEGGVVWIRAVVHAARQWPPRTRQKGGGLATTTRKRCRAGRHHRTGRDSGRNRRTAKASGV